MNEYKITKTIHRVLSFVLLGIGIVWFGLPLLIWGGQLLEWLSRGVWHNYSLRIAAESFGVGVPQVSWLGVQKIINFIFGLPTAIVVLFAGWAVASMVMHMMDELARDMDDYERKQART